MHKNQKLYRANWGNGTTSFYTRVTKMIQRMILNKGLQLNDGN